jgi:sterol desaturase/sphingolipid hydroxylase (fatty acid hydroxylase superfamily)
MNPLIMILTGAAFFFCLERIFPDQKLPKIEKWWIRNVIINTIQVGILILGGYTWDQWFKGRSFFEVEAYAGKWPGILISYLALTFIYYWWHRFRHTFYFLWITMHQTHHSPNRIETVTSFYKHPLEICVNAILISFIAYTLFGLTPESGAYLTVITAYAEFFYHMNVKTPRWLGYILQRPEMHRIHHQRDRHFNNFADLPVWDMLFGTFQNPKTYQGLCGYKVEREQKIWDMLIFKDVNNLNKKKTTN